MLLGLSVHEAVQWLLKPKMLRGQQDCTGAKGAAGLARGNQEKKANGMS